MHEELQALRVLGKNTGIPAKPDDALLDVVSNEQDYDYVVRFTIPEFTTLCPVTSQPDFATLVIDYVPRQWLVESKSLKLFATSFRNYKGFHEDCTMTVGRRIALRTNPKWLRIAGYWNPRGGIPIDVFWQQGALPPGVWVPSHDVPLYRGR